MNFRTLILSTAAIAALLPSISNASAESAALGACTRAFAASMAAPGSSAPSFKLKYRGSQAGSAIADYYSGREYTFYLKAHDQKSGATLARATCTADAGGAQIALTATPLEGSDATLAAR
jgi:hypothetical protein